jgi:hypothetical protein
MSCRRSLAVLPLCAALLAACTQFPALDDSVSAQTRAAPYPDLVPLERLTSQVPSPRADASATEAALNARLARLRARAAGLRGGVLTGREKLRLQQGLH